jgi:catechol 2,3-dioxygenase-like lactoylglutathione lyase family enzyme
MQVEVIALDHIYIAVLDLHVSEEFYDPVMRLLDFRKGTGSIAGEPHLHYYNRVLQYTLRPSHSDAAHDPYAAGLHHLCFRVQSRAEVDAAARGLRELGVSATEPRSFPEYDPDYYATFFEDPDGIRLEIVAEVERRRLIREHWSSLTEFENPLAKAGLLRR